MPEIKCTIVQDVLPLYIDDVVSFDTREMISEHLQQCEKCQKEYETMKRKLYIPVENKAPIIEKIHKNWRKKKIFITMVSVFATAFILFGAFAYIFYYEKMIPYSETLFKVEMQKDHQLVSHYYGKSYAGVKATHPMLLEIDGKKKNVSFIYYTKTIADSPSRNLVNQEKGDQEQNNLFTFPESEKIDAVYYVDFDVEKVYAKKDSWESILKRAVLLWEK